MDVELSDGVRLRTMTTGTPSAAPPVVLLHGGPGLWDYLEPIARLIDDRTVVHRFDQRGCGGSGPSDDQSMRRLQDDIEELRLHWGHEKIVVIGHSFGATLALTYAAAYPDSVLRVGYLGGAGAGDWLAQAEAEQLRRMTPSQAARLEQLVGRKRTQEEETEFRALSWFTDHADRERAWGWALEDAAAPYPINFAANRAINAETNAWSDEDRARTAAAVTAPVWFVHGDGDPRPASAVRELAGHVAQHEFRLIEGAGHSLYRERPDAVRAVLTELIS
ncbi:proline iminopeptidase [Kribbella voronezhensis]|uniref:Proline iminopeptidase n=1 Tax=Kribbella voronezhensis TaxID=2512212 RepID=A0A4R7T8N6_9ACTN|nr:alpha/beta hydrolase [Kribbella voronezhensis]TDU88195.1 proline iminopeptidase [Kribbella voronezhensis]